MSSEGSREIEAARKRLAAAKAHESSASSNLETARSMMNKAESMMSVAESNMTIANSMMAAATAATKSAESMKNTAEGNIKDAETQMSTSHAEAEDAEKFLKEAEKRWEVVDVDAPTELQSDKTSRKKRKVSLSPKAANNNEASASPANNDIAAYTSFSERLAQMRASFEKRHGVSSDSESSASSDANDSSAAAGKSSQTVYHKVQEAHTSTWSEILPSGFFKHKLKSKNSLLPSASPSNSSIATMRETFHQTGLLKDLKILPHVKLHSILRVYTMEVDKFDVELFHFCGRHVVDNESSWYLTKPNPKPKAGAFIVAINDRLLPLGITSEEVNDYYMYNTRGDKVTMTFVEDYDFMSMYAEDIEPNLSKLREEERRKEQEKMTRNAQLREKERRKEQEKQIRNGEVVGLICGGEVVNADGKSIEEITVSSCGVPGANGTFNKSSFAHDGVPMYEKIGMWKGKEESFWILRRQLSSKKTWHLLCGGKQHSGSGIQKPAAYLFSVDCSSFGWKDKPLYNIPPKAGWKLAKSSKGVGPCPQLKWE